MQVRRSLTGALGAALLAAGGAVAQEETSNNRVAAETDWSVFVDENPKECWSVSVPTNSVLYRDGRVSQGARGDILLMVFYRPGTDAQGQVAFNAGYPLRENSNVTVEIGGDQFSLFIAGQWAWPETPADDARLVAAMKRGVNAQVTGYSARGARTVDTFSLLGFTAAVEEAEKRCTG